MGIVRTLVWTALCVGFGIFLGSYPLGGQTAWQRAQGAWKQQSPHLEKVKDGAEGLVDDVKKKVSTQEVAQPKEQHRKEDREAIEQLISKRQKG